MSSIVFSPVSGSTVEPTDSLTLTWSGWSGSVNYYRIYIETSLGYELAVEWNIFDDEATFTGGFGGTSPLTPSPSVTTIYRHAGWDKQSGTMNVRMETEDTFFNEDVFYATYTIDPLPVAEPVTAHTQTGLDRMLDQFAGSVNLRLLASSYLDQAQAFENAAYPIMNARNLDWATGDRLDGIGDIISLERSGLVDADYRTALQIELRVLRSNGTGNELIEIIDAFFPGFLTGGGDIDFYELYPKTIYVRLVDANMGTQPAGTPDRVANTLRRAMSAATELLYVYGYYNDDELFTLSSQGATTESDTDTGLANTAQTTGGHLTVTA